MLNSHRIQKHWNLNSQWMSPGVCVVNRRIVDRLPALNSCHIFSVYHSIYLYLPAATAVAPTYPGITNGQFTKHNIMNGQSWRNQEDANIQANWNNILYINMYIVYNKPVANREPKETRVCNVNIVRPLHCMHFWSNKYSLFGSYGDAVCCYCNTSVLFNTAKRQKSHRVENRYSLKSSHTHISTAIVAMRWLSRTKYTYSCSRFKFTSHTVRLRHQCKSRFGCSLLMNWMWDRAHTISVCQSVLLLLLWLIIIHISHGWSECGGLNIVGYFRSMCRRFRMSVRMWNTCVMLLCTAAFGIKLFVSRSCCSLFKSTTNLESMVSVWFRASRQLLVHQKSFKFTYHYNQPI